MTTLPAWRKDRICCLYPELASSRLIFHAYEARLGQNAQREKIFQAPDFYAKHGHEAARLKEDLEAARGECERLYSRWEYLENKKN